MCGQKDRPALQKISTTEQPPGCCQGDLCNGRIKVRPDKRVPSIQNFPFLNINFLEIKPSSVSAEKGGP